MFHGNKGDTTQTQMPIKKAAQPLSSIKSLHSLYFVRNSKPFKGLIRISNGKQTTLSIVHQLQTAFKTVSREHTLVIFFLFLKVLLFFSPSSKSYLLRSWWQFIFTAAISVIWGQNVGVAGSESLTQG